MYYFHHVMKIALIGYGKMGHEIERILVSRGHTLPLIIDLNNTDQLTAENMAGGYARATRGCCQTRATFFLILSVHYS